jgi:hypothetical protein
MRASIRSCVTLRDGLIVTPITGDLSSSINMLGGLCVTGAKPRAGVEILLAPTRVGSIQPDRDRPG